jgi:hypothetical protein
MFPSVHFPENWVWKFDLCVHCGTRKIFRPWRRYDQKYSVQKGLIIESKIVSIDQSGNMNRQNSVSFKWMATNHCKYCSGNNKIIMFHWNEISIIVSGNSRKKKCLNWVNTNHWQFEKKEFRNSSFARKELFGYRGLAVTSRDDVIDGRPPYWRYFFRAARVVLIEITLENGRK